MSSFADRAAAGGSYEGVAAGALARRLEVPAVLAFGEVTSTLDVAHAAAAGGAASGTLVLADAQTAGRGRMGRRWVSEPRHGIWLTLIERPRDGSALDVLSLRIGIELAPVLDAFADRRVHLKWPNDVYVGGGKLAGVLSEARWRGESLDWVAIGVGVNVRAPAAERGVGLLPGTSRLDVLDAAVPAIRRAAARRGPLSDAELAAFAARDFAAGRACLEPTPGRVRGIDAGGALLVEVASGVTAFRAGSLVLQGEGEP